MQIKEHPYRGLYIAFEGGNKSGKTTQSRKLLEYLRIIYPDTEVIWGREPGTGEIPEAIRHMVQGKDVFSEEMDPICEAYLYAASRAQVLQRIDAPVLERGGIVIKDRSFVSSLIFQGVGRKLGRERVWNINAEAVGMMFPDRILFIHRPLEQAMDSRIADRGDKFEFMEHGWDLMVIEAYLALARDFPKWIEVIDGQGTIDEVFSRIQYSVIPLIDQKGIKSRI